MHRKTIIQITIGIISFILFLLFVFSQRTFRIYIIIFAVLILVVRILIFGSSVLSKFSGVLLCTLIGFILFLCTAPGIMKPIFFKMEEFRFSILHFVYEKDVEALIPVIKQDREEKSENYNSLSRIPNRIELLADSVWVKSDNESYMVVYITEWDHQCGYAWISDSNSLKLTKGFAEVKQAEQNWYYVQIYH